MITTPGTTAPGGHATGPAHTGDRSGTNVVAQAVEYTCPMHPEIRRPRPAACPICGMSLDRVTVTADTGPSEELRDMTRRFWVGVALSVPVVLLEMVGHFVPAIRAAVGGERASVIWQFVLATPVVLWGGWPFFVRGAASLRTRSLDMFTLIALGTRVAWLFSVVATLAPGLFPASLRDMDGGVDVYFEAAAVITTLVLLGQVLRCAPANVPQAPFGRCSTLLPRRPTASSTVRSTT
jgi:cation transport ATPase